MITYGQSGPRVQWKERIPSGFGWLSWASHSLSIRSLICRDLWLIIHNHLQIRTTSYWSCFCVSTKKDTKATNASVLVSINSNQQFSTARGTCILELDHCLVVRQKFPHQLLLLHLTKKGTLHIEIRSLPGCATEIFSSTSFLAFCKLKF